MKKTLTKIFYIIISTLLMLLSFSGCIQTSVLDNLIEQGDFGYYYYIEEEDCYAVLDLTEEGNQKEVLYNGSATPRRNCRS